MRAIFLCKLDFSVKRGQEQFFHVVYGHWNDIVERFLVFWTGQVSEELTVEGLE